MIVQCPACSSRYRVNASNIPASGGKIRCPSCQHTFVVYPEAPKPAAAAPSGGFDEDATSIAARPDLQKLMNNFNASQGIGGADATEVAEDEGGATEVMSADSVPDFLSSLNAGRAPEIDDGTVEMQNPLSFLSGKPAIPSRTTFDSGATEVVSADSVFGSGNDRTEIASPDDFRVGAVEPPSNPMFGSSPMFGKGPSAPPLPMRADAPTVKQPEAAPSGGQDPSYGGPWKLKTNFGLTYEFADTASLLQWMSSREELDGYTLSGQGDFAPLSSYPQLAGRASGKGPMRTARPQQMNTGPLPAIDAPAPPPPSGPQPGFGAPVGFGPPAQGSITQRGERIQTNYQHPSRDAKWDKVLWVLFILLGISAIVIGLQLTGVVDLRAMLLGAPAPSPVTAPIVSPPAAPEAVIEAPPGETAAAEATADVVDEESLNLLIEDARRALKNNKYAFAREKLETAQALNPKRLEVYDLLVEAYEATNDKDKAEQTRQQAAALRAAP